MTVKLTNVSWDLEINQVAKITLDANLVFDAPTNMNDGGIYTLTLTQEGVGSRTAAWASVYKWPGGTPPTLSTAASAVDAVSCLSDGTNMQCTWQVDFK